MEICVKKILLFVFAMFVCVIVLPALIVGPFAAKEANPGSTEEPLPDGSQSSGDSNATVNPSSSVNINPNATNNVTAKVPDKINVFDVEQNKIVSMSIDEYVKGVVLGEMPLNFEVEALKAQAIAARTYVYRRYINNTVNQDHPNALICTDSEHCQSWSDPNIALPAIADTNNKETIAKINKLDTAIETTKGLIITYEGKPIDALYHSNSGGMTEDANNVWSGTVPYLVSVESKGESNVDVFKNEYGFTYDVFINSLKEKYKDIKIDKNNIIGDIKSIKRSKSNRIVSLEIGGAKMTGKDVRSIFQLSSTNIWFTDSKDGRILITCYGNGHGVGLSQYGANARAEEGLKFEEIIKHYYKDVEIKNFLTD